MNPTTKTWGRFCLLLVLLVVAFAVWGQNPAKKVFPLNKEIFGVVMGCEKKNDAVSIVRQKDETKALARYEVLSAQGKCGVGPAVVTYQKLVYKKGKVKVYQGKIGKSRAYLITDWEHEVVKT